MWWRVVSEEEVTESGCIVGDAVACAVLLADSFKNIQSSLDCKE